MDLKSNEPFWLVKNGLLASYPSLKKDADCDVLIVGGGITGSLIAHQCVKDGYKTILIDKREICNGSSSATTSMLQYEVDTPLYKLIEEVGEKAAIESYRACAAAIDDLGKIAAKIRSKAGFRKKASLYYASRKKDAQWLKKECEVRKEAGFDVRWLEPGEILEKYDIHLSHGGILSKQGGSIDAFCFAHELLQYNYKRGLKIYDKTALVNVRYKRGFNLCSTAAGVIVKAKKVVYCVGYESADMIKEKFVDLISTYAIVSEVNVALYKKYSNVLLWNTAEPYLYMRTTDDSRFLIGGEDEAFHNATKRDDLIGKKEQKLVNAFQSIFPGKAFFADFAWAGTFGKTKDGLPYIGEHKDFKNSYFVCGFGGNGITFSVTGMQMVSDWLKGKKHPLWQWFRFGR